MPGIPDITVALRYAECIIDRRCGNNGYRERAVDLTTDAILAAARNFDPGRGSWPQLYGWVVNRAVNRAIESEARRSAKQRAAARSKARGRPAPTAARRYPPEDLAELPEPLRRVVELHVNCGFSVPETGLLCGGLTAKAVRLRLIAAAGHLRREVPA